MQNSTRNIMYLRTVKTTKSNPTSNFTFVTPDMHTITEEDRLLGNDIYDLFFEEKSKGKNFTMIDIKGNTFNEIFKELESVPINPLDIPLTVREQHALRDAIDTVILTTLSKV